MDSRGGHAAAAIAAASGSESDTGWCARTLSTAAARRLSSRAEQTVAGVAQSRHDVTV